MALQEKLAERMQISRGKRPPSAVGRPFPVALRVARIVLQIQRAPAPCRPWPSPAAAILPLFPAPGVLAQNSPQGSGSTGIQFQTWLRSMPVGWPAVMPPSSRGYLAAARPRTTTWPGCQPAPAGSHRDFGGAFRGLDARIPREMDQKVAKPWELWPSPTCAPGGPAAAPERRPEVLSPLPGRGGSGWMTPAREEGRQGYKLWWSLVSRPPPYTAGYASP